ASHEAQRNIWFLLLDGKITPASFDRLKNEWTFLGDGPMINPVSIIEAYQVYALPNRLVVRENNTFKVYDTTDLDDLKEVPGGEVPVPSGTWAATAIPKTTGGDLQVLAKNCAPAALTCNVELTRIAVQAAGVQAASPTTVSEV